MCLSTVEQATTQLTLCNQEAEAFTLLRPGLLHILALCLQSQQIWLFIFQGYAGVAYVLLRDDNRFDNDNVLPLSNLICS